jgi:hypothetical protein
MWWVCLALPIAGLFSLAQSFPYVFSRNRKSWRNDDYHESSGNCHRPLAPIPASHLFCLWQYIAVKEFFG